ncbi:hypothetical protein CJ483_23780 [Bacillus sp. PK3_68]|nr:hypothetical protein CJ483_23780 [Bacillus sp. PK3_68]
MWSMDILLINTFNFSLYNYPIQPTVIQLVKHPLSPQLMAFTAFDVVEEFAAKKGLPNNKIADNDSAKTFNSFN